MRQRGKANSRRRSAPRSIGGCAMPPAQPAPGWGAPSSAPSTSGRDQLGAGLPGGAPHAAVWWALAATTAAVAGVGAWVLTRSAAEAYYSTVPPQVRA